MGKFWYFDVSGILSPILFSTFQKRLIIDPENLIFYRKHQNRWYFDPKSKICYYWWDSSTFWSCNNEKSAFFSIFHFFWWKKDNLLNFRPKIFYQISKNCLLELINANFNSLKSFCCEFVLKIFVQASNLDQIWVI